MARLPIPGSDDGTWGDILNSFLVVAHNTDGTLKGNSLTSPGDITISSDSDASGAGDIVLKTGTTERLRFNTDGSMLWKNQVLVTRTFQSNPRADIPAGTNVFEIDEYGNVLFGPNDFLFTRQGNIFQLGSIADFMYHQETRRIYTRSAAFVEFGDPPDVIIARAGPDNIYPGVAGGLAGIPSGTTLGVIRWQGSFTPQGGTVGVTQGGAFHNDSAQIYAKATEDNKFNGGVSYSQGGELHFATTPNGTATPVDALIISSDQTVTAKKALTVAGLTGATAASRYVGATASGAPATGTFAAGDFVVDQSGALWVCVSGGTPGTWKQIGGTFPGGAPGLKNAKYVPIFGSNLGTGDHDLYTVPVGRQALVDRVQTLYNIAGSGGSIVYFPEIKVSGTYYRVGANVTAADGAAGSSSMTTAIVLGAGETFACNTATTAGLNVRGGVWEFDADDTRLFTARKLGLASGDNLLYTCPAGKTVAFIQGAEFVTSMSSSVQVCNNTGGSLNYYLNVVPSGGSVGPTNRLGPATAVADKANTAFNGAQPLSPGDFISVNASGPDAGGHHIAWVTGYQLP